jgi:hypothetical protein
MMTLKEHVRQWAEEHVEEGYPASRALAEVCEHGCLSGIVGHLIYYTDTIKFYEQFQKEIWELAIEEADSQGGNVFTMLGNCNHGSPSDYETVVNFLAWFGFEETARRMTEQEET